jgi:hypothetical protein
MLTGDYQSFKDLGWSDPELRPGQWRKIVLFTVVEDVSKDLGKYTGATEPDDLRKHTVGKNLMIVRRRYQYLPNLQSA